MKKIKIAQIGINRHSHARPIFGCIAKQKDIFEVAGFALVEDEREKFSDLLGVFDGYTELTLEEVLSDPEIEAVTVETEEIHLTKYALMAAKHHKHIHMEKPGGQEPADFEKLIAFVKEKKLIFHTGYMYRYNPCVIELMQKVKTGELGEIISVEAQMNCRHCVEVREWLSTFQGGMMFFLGCHLIDLILQIQGKPNRIISLNKATHMDGVASTDFGMAVFEYDNGVSFAKTNAVERGGFARRQLVVTGTKKTIELKPFEVFAFGGQYTEQTEYDLDEWSYGGKHTKTGVYDRYDGMMASFAQMVRGEKENPYTYDYELELYKTILECCGSKN